MVVALRKNLVLTDSDDTFISDFSANFEYQYNYIKEHYIDDSNINGTVYGTLTDNFGIISGFSGSNYITLPELTLGDNFEIGLKFTYVSSSNNYEELFRYDKTLAISIHTQNNRVIHFNSGNGSTWRGTNTEGITSLTSGSTYWVKVIVNNGSREVYLSSDGINYNLECSGDCATQPALTYYIGVDEHFHTTWFHGSVDLKECYIKINGEKVWNGYTIQSLKLYDVLKSFASYVSLIATGLPTGASIEWFLPEGNETDTKIDVIKGSLVPYVVAFADTSKYIGYHRANEDWILDCTDLISNTVTLTINPDPSDATVELEVEGGNPFEFEQVGNSITVSPGTKVHYTVSKTDYITQSNVIIVNETQTVNITLSETLYTYIIHPTPADATVTLTASGYTQLDNSISVSRGTTVEWSVSANNYVSQSGTKVVNDNCADNISLKALVELTITPTPADATVTLIATGYSQVGNSIKVPYGTTVVWMVEKTGYTTKSGSKIMTEDTEAQIILDEMLTLTIVPSPNDAIVHLTSAGYIQQGNSITVPYGTAVDWEVSKEGMGTKQGRKVVTVTQSMDVVLSRYVTFTITPTPSNATVELTADGYEQEGNSITILSGTRVHWKVYKSGYIPQSNYVIVNDDTTLPISLEQAATLTINPTPADSIVTLTAEGYGQYGNKITVPLNTRVYWSVVKTGYTSQYGHEDMTADLTKNITLIQN